MYFLLKMGIFQPAMLVYQRVYGMYIECTCVYYIYVYIHLYYVICKRSCFFVSPDIPSQIMVGWIDFYYWSSSPCFCSAVFLSVAPPTSEANWGVLGFTSDLLGMNNQRFPPTSTCFCAEKSRSDGCHLVDAHPVLGKKPRVFVING